MVQKENKEYSWKKELARDFIAIGSIPFFILVIARVYMADEIIYPVQYFIAAIIFFILFFLFKADSHAGVGSIAAILTIVYYNEIKFSIFAGLIYLGILISIFYLKKDNIGIIKGVLFGLIASGVGYYAGQMIFG